MLPSTFYVLLVFGPALLVFSGLLTGVALLACRRSRLSLSAVLVLLNVAGAIAYLYIASRVWLKPELRESNTFPVGEATFWFMYALPVFVAFALSDLTILCLSLHRFLKKKEWNLKFYAVAIPAIWVLTLHFEFAHH